MFKKFLGDLQAPKNRYPIADDLHGSKLGFYYFIFDEQRVARGKDQKLIGQFDKNGIPVNKTYIDVTEKEYVYFPISIGQMGLAVFHTYLKTKSPDDKERFLKFAEWFTDNALLENNLGARWLTDVALPQYKNPGPWQSAFAQSRAISILLRGYQLTKETKYCDLAENALRSFTAPVNKGGVTSYTDKGPFYEEYTAEGPTLVLNGMIFSLFGIMDFVRIFPDNKVAKKIHDEGIITLQKILPEYDLGFWSRYNLCQLEGYPEIDPSTVGYQRLHINQLDVMYRYTGNDMFKYYMEKFKQQDNWANILKMYKIKYKSLKVLNRL
jgi:hypothetical protein